MNFIDSSISVRIENIVSQYMIRDWRPVHLLVNKVNSKNDGAKDAARALRRKLQSSNPQEQLNVISVTQALIEGSGALFQAHLATSKFSEVIERVLRSDKTSHHVKVRLMERLSVWTTDFVSDPSLTAIPDLYCRMQEADILKDVDPALSMPVLSPQPRPAPVHHNPQGAWVHHPVPRVSPGRVPVQPVQPVRMLPEQWMALILQDIEVANNNAQMLTEAISFANPETEAIEENALIKEFCSGCLSLHRRIVDHLTGVTESAQPNSTLLEKLLACNLGLALALKSYDQLIQKPRPSSGEQVVQTQGNNTSSTSLESTQPYQTTATSVVTENDDAEATLVNSGGREGNRKSIVTVEEPSQGPFSDDAYRVSESLEIAAAVRKGKQPDGREEAVSQEEQEQIQLAQRRSLLRSDQIGSSSSVSTAAGSTSPTIVAAYVVTRVVSPVV